jgi:hypothetical protein
MRNLIIERVEALQKEKQDGKKIPANPNELELSKDLRAMLGVKYDSSLFEHILDMLITEGRITIVGHTINKLRILSI